MDSDTPKSKWETRRLHDGRSLKLVLSDEFEEEGRSFGASDDKYFHAVEKPDDTNQAIEFYNSSREYVTTKDGSLVLTTRAVKTSWVGVDGLGKPSIMTKNYTSGMVQSWNKFCFTGGVLELSIQLPGDAYSGGLWPAAWLMGNLVRATYDGAVHKWPWSYDRCEADLATKQEINACNGKPGFGLHPHQGRGAPEIDIFEVMPGHNMPGHDSLVRPFMSNSLQVSPGIPAWRNRPKNGEKLSEGVSWYSNLRYDSSRSALNDGFWGQECGPEYDDTPTKLYKYQEDALSVNTDLNQTHFDSHHVYRLEWEPGSTAAGGGGYLEWYLDGEFVFGISGDSLASATGALIPQEPMYLILNTAISHRWGMPEPCDRAHCDTCWICYDCTNPECQCTLPDGMKNCKNLPAEMKIDYVRLYQDIANPSHTLGCSPPGFPTAEYIAGHAADYADWRPANAPTQHTLTEAGYVALSAVSALLATLLVCAIWWRACTKVSWTVVSSADNEEDRAGRRLSVSVSVNADRAIPNVRTHLLAPPAEPTHQQQQQQQQRQDPIAKARATAWMQAEAAAAQGARMQTKRDGAATPDPPALPQPIPSHYKEGPPPAPPKSPVPRQESGNDILSLIGLVPLQTESKPLGGGAAVGVRAQRARESAQGGAAPRL